MNRLFVATALAIGLGFAAAPASAAVYCKTVGVPKGCVARPVAAPGINQPGAAGNVGAAGASVGNRNGGVNRAGPRR